mmetsp:Transcript_12953/g.19522  ORF Transcript_12953/g.19522 Transcript_12953/m.19522 type:complete len:230 (+) Transcript_12953:25-714(+)
MATINQVNRINQTLQKTYGMFVVEEWIEGFLKHIANKGIHPNHLLNNVIKAITNANLKKISNVKKTIHGYRMNQQNMAYITIQPKLGKDLHNITLTGPYCTQIVKAIDIAMPLNQPETDNQTKQDDEKMEDDDIVQKLQDTMDFYEKNQSTILNPTKKTSVTKKKHKRCLKLTLTDGFDIFTAIEYAPIPIIPFDEDLMGTKLVLATVVFRRGILLLTPSNCQFYGGSI